MEELPGERQAVDRVGLRLDAQVVVARVEPAAAVEAGDVVAGLELGEGRGPLHVVVKVVVVDGRHERVVDVGEAVPDAVVVVHAHVGHLDGQEILDRRLPDVALEHVVADLEDVRALVAVSDGVHSRPHGVA